MGSKDRYLEILQELNTIDFVIDVTKEDKALIGSHNFNTIKTFLEEQYSHSKCLLEQANVYENYLLKIVKRYISLEEYYHDKGYRNTANIELANSDVTDEINQDLEKLEKLLLKIDESIVYYPHIENEKIYFKTDKDRYTNDSLRKYDLDIYPIVESNSK